jgi:hypothetical protein
MVASDIARPRAAFGKISEMYTHTPGPRLTAKQKTYARMSEHDQRERLSLPVKREAKCGQRKPHARRAEQKQDAPPDTVDCIHGNYRSSEVRHPPRSGWLDELGRLKGGWFADLGVARRAPYWFDSKLSACSIRHVLLADVGADLLQFEPNG